MEGGRKKRQEPFSGEIVKSVPLAVTGGLIAAPPAQLMAVKPFAYRRNSQKCSEARPPSDPIVRMSFSEAEPRTGITARVYRKARGFPPCTAAEPQPLVATHNRLPLYFVAISPFSFMISRVISAAAYMSFTSSHSLTV